MTTHHATGIDEECHGCRRDTHCTGQSSVTIEEVVEGCVVRGEKRLCSSTRIADVHTDESNVIELRVGGDQNGELSATRLTGGEPKIDDERLPEPRVGGDEIASGVLHLH